MTLLIQLRACVVVFALAAAAFSMAGCGGGDNGHTEATVKSLTKSQFIKQAEGICQKGLERKDQQVKATAEKNHSTVLSGSPKELQTLVEEALIPAYQNLVGELKDLNPPSQDRATVAKINREYDAALKTTEKEPLQAVKENPFAQPDQAASKYGIANCML